MAEFVMKDLVKKVGLEDSFMIESAATSTEEIGNSVYPQPDKNWQSTASVVRERRHGR